MITSLRNEQIKHYKRLLNRGQKAGAALELPLEGLHLVEEALNCGVHLHTLFFAPELVRDRDWLRIKEKMPASMRCLQVSPEVFEYISQTDSPQGIAAIAKYPEPDLQDILQQPHLQGVMVDSLQDPGNWGAIVRTAAAAGFTAVFYNKGTVNLANDKFLRATAGALFRLPVAYVPDNAEFVANLKERGIKMVAATPQAAKSYYETDLLPPCLLVIGNENRGISSSLLPDYATSVNIPQHRGVESLNASVAAGVLIYEALRQLKTRG